MKIIRYIAKKDTNLIITPVWIPSVNDKEIEPLIRFAIEIGAGKKRSIPIGIQNFLNYQFGKNPVKQKPMEKFYAELEQLEKKYKIKLIFKEGFFKKTKTLPKPFRKSEVITAKLVCNGRLKNEMLAVAKERVISVFNTNKKAGDNVKLKIVRTKDNIFVGDAVK